MGFGSYLEEGKGMESLGSLNEKESSYWGMEREK